MKKFARYLLVFILITILSGAIGFLIVNTKTAPVYQSTTQLYVIPGQESENSLRASSGGLNEDFAIIFKSNLVISDAQKTVGTTEDLASYITVNAPAKSNIIEITCKNPDQATAKKYVDAVAKSALKTTSIIPVEKISILTEGTQSNIAVKPDVYRNTAYIVIIAMAITFVVEMVIGLLISAFAKNDEDDEAEYNRYYGDNARFTQMNSYTRSDAMKSMELAAATIEKNETEELLKKQEDFQIEDIQDDDIQDDDILSEDISHTLAKEVKKVQEDNDNKSSSDILVKIPR